MVHGAGWGESLVTGCRLGRGGGEFLGTGCRLGGGESLGTWCMLGGVPWYRVQAGGVGSPLVQGVGWGTGFSASVNLYSVMTHTCDIAEYSVTQM